MLCLVGRSIVSEWSNLDDVYCSVDMPASEIYQDPVFALKLTSQDKFRQQMKRILSER